MISHKYKCLFIHVPKTAGYAIELALPGEYNYDGYERINHYKANALKLIVPHLWDDYFSFSFIRNPWGRFVSEFTWLHWKGYKYIPKDFKEFAFKVLTNRENYYKMIEKSSPPNSFPWWKKDGHLDSQLDFLTEKGNIIVNFIGKFETLEHDWKEICKHIRTPTIPLSNPNKSNTRPYWEFYDNETRDLVYNVYKKDIEYFNYDFVTE